MDTLTVIAFIYPGQGSQRVGMGAALRASNPELFGSWFEAAEQASGLPLRRFVLDGPRAAQPAALRSRT